MSNELSAISKRRKAQGSKERKRFIESPERGGISQQWTKHFAIERK